MNTRWLNTKTYIATLIIGGYFGIGLVAILLIGDRSVWAQSMTHDALTGLFPLVVLIVREVFRENPGHGPIDSGKP